MIRPVDGPEERLQALARVAGQRPVDALPEDLVATAILAARSRARRRRERRVMAAVAVTLLGAGVFTWAALRAGAPEPVATEAPSSPAPAEKPPAPAPSVTVLPTGDRLVRAGEGELELASLGSHRELHLSRGEMLFEVVPLGEGESFVVVTPHLRARVVGTIFALRVDEDGSAVDVYEGVVELTHPGAEPMRLRAGESWAPGDGSWTSRLAARGRAAAERRAHEPAAPPEEPAAPTEELAASAPARPSSREPTLETVRGWLTQGEAERARVAAAAQVARRPRDGAWRMVLGDAQRVTGDRAAAADTYDVAATLLSESQATQAGYLAAELRLARGDGAGALRSLERARATERGSPVAERASALALRARVSMGDRDGFVRAARAYRLRFPSGSAGPWIERELARSSQETTAPE